MNTMTDVYKRKDHNLNPVHMNRSLLFLSLTHRDLQSSFAFLN